MRNNYGSGQGDNPDVLVVVVRFFQSMASGQFTAYKAPQANYTLE